MRVRLIALALLLPMVADAQRIRRPRQPGEPPRTGLNGGTDLPKPAPGISPIRQIPWKYRLFSAESYPVVSVLQTSNYLGLGPASYTTLGAGFRLDMRVVPSLSVSLESTGSMFGGPFNMQTYEAGLRVRPWVSGPTRPWASASLGAAYTQGYDNSAATLAGVPVDVWHADGDGYYDSQRPDYETTGPSSRARFITDADGKFFFRTILPCSYPIPTDGPVGEMILQTRRHPMRPAHVHFLVNAKGYEPLITHVFMDGDKYLDSDVVFGVKDDLISRIEKRTDATMPDGKPAKAPWHLMSYEFHVKPGAGAAPQPLGIKPGEAA